MMGWSNFKMLPQIVVVIPVLGTPEQLELGLVLQKWNYIKCLGRRGWEGSLKKACGTFLGRDQQWQRSRLRCGDSGMLWQWGLAMW